MYGFKGWGLPNLRLLELAYHSVSSLQSLPSARRHALPHVGLRVFIFKSIPFNFIYFCPFSVQTLSRCTQITGAVKHPNLRLLELANNSFSSLQSLPSARRHDFARRVYGFMVVGFMGVWVYGLLVYGCRFCTTPSRPSRLSRPLAGRPEAGPFPKIASLRKLADLAWALLMYGF